MAPGLIFALKPIEDFVGGSARLGIFEGVAPELIQFGRGFRRKSGGGVHTVLPEVQNRLKAGGSLCKDGGADDAGL
jgi:hypothetical protein